MHACSVVAHTNVDMAAMVMRGYVEGHGKTINGHPQQVKCIRVFDAVWKGRGQHNRVVQHIVLKVHIMLSALVKFVGVDNGEARTPSLSTYDSNY